MIRPKAISSVLLLGCMSWVAGCASEVEVSTSDAIVFEGARLITGDDGPPVEDSVFVVENGVFTMVGRQGQIEVPEGAERIDLTGKTVMPGKVDLHGHLGYQHAADGTMAKEFYTRENLIDHLEPLAYFGVTAVVGIGDLVDRSDLAGGRTDWGNVPLQVRDEVISGAALFRTSGPGILGRVPARRAILPGPTSPIRSLTWTKPGQPSWTTRAWSPLSSRSG